MRRAADAEAFRLHFERVALGSLLASVEAEAEQHALRGRRRRAGRAEREAARLRMLVASLAPQQPPVRPDELLATAATQSLRARISAYTVGPSAQTTARGGGVRAEQDDSIPPVRRLPGAAVRSRAGHRLLWPLTVLWLACAFALAASLLVNGIDSTTTAVAETTLLPLTLALFLAYIESGPAAVGVHEVVAEIGASSFASVSDAEPVRERRSRLDRRQHLPETREHPVERRSGRDRRRSERPSLAAARIDA